MALFGLVIALMIRAYWPQIEQRLPSWLRDLDRGETESEPAYSGLLAASCLPLTGHLAPSQVFRTG